MEILEKINIQIYEDYVLEYINVYMEKSHDYISKGNYSFEPGKIYGIICEQGSGGEGIAQILTNPQGCKAKAYFDDDKKNVFDYSWYVGKPIKQRGAINRELTVYKALENAIRTSEKYKDVYEVVDKFHLSTNRMNYTLSKIDIWEKWRASLAIGFAGGKSIFCFPWMDSLYFYDCMINSSVFRFFNTIKQNSGLVILPTSRTQNVQGIADEIINLNCPRFNRCVSDTEYFKTNF